MSTSRFHKGDVPETVLRAARQMLDRAPADQLSVRELARSAGVSHAAPYRHFRDREGFLTALTTLCLNEFVDAQQRAAGSVEAGEELLAMGAAYVTFAVEHPHVFQLVYAPRIGEDPALRDVAARHEALLRSAVTAAVAGGSLPADIDEATLAQALWSLAHGLAHLVSGGFLPRDGIRPVLAALLRTDLGSASQGSDR